MVSLRDICLACIADAVTRAYARTPEENSSGGCGGLYMETASEIEPRLAGYQPSAEPHYKNGRGRNHAGSVEMQDCAASGT